MTFAWLKRYVPRSLYGRAALILLTPIITLQLVLTIMFVQRHYEDVTVQMTRAVALELAYIQRRVDAAAAEGRDPEEVRRLARALRLTLTLPDPDAPMADRRRFFDLAGRKVIDTLHENLRGLSGADLIRSDSHAVVGFETGLGPMSVGIPRSLVSASNPHQLLVLTGGVSVLMSLIAFLFLKNQIRPIRRLAEAAEAFGRGRDHAYRPSGATETRAAGAAFLDMRNRIERQIEQRTIMLSGVSHDLRTPLTRLKLGLSMLDEDAEVEAMLGDVRDMEAMLDTFLDFARSDSLDDAEAVEPGEILKSLVAQADRVGQNVTVAALPGAGKVVLRPLAVRRALENLVGNAVRYGSRAELSCVVSERAVVFSVEDDGPGIPPDAREEALRPFSRLDRARSQNRGGGVGLGLSIAFDIARQHGGTLRLDRSARLGGLRADLVLAR
ncbi:ATP-binding protein [Oceaniglobus roseus]|uniref:ATP-binding protein n=1 Tax=Oceaniglobus roseus TaxID=1737570 RepID=UPI000C7EFF70|nr:ATP-binding protein [Kandeliimicrobium roseum]